MFERMVRPEIDGGVGSGRFTVNAYIKVGWVSGYGKVKEVDTVTRFEGGLSWMQLWIVSMYFRISSGLPQPARPGMYLSLLNLPP